MLYICLNKQGDTKPRKTQNTMNFEIIKTNADWKLKFLIFWHNTPKKKRKTRLQIDNIKLQAKLHTALFSSTN